MVFSQFVESFLYDLENFPSLQERRARFIQEELSDDKEKELLPLLTAKINIEKMKINSK